MAASLHAKARRAGEGSAVRAVPEADLAEDTVRSNVNQCNRWRKFLCFSYICFTLYDKCMFDWNFIAGLIATVAFDIIYFGAIIGTITVIILDNRNPVKTMAWILVLMWGLCSTSFSAGANGANASLERRATTAC